MANIYGNEIVLDMTGKGVILFIVNGTGQVLTLPQLLSLSSSAFPTQLPSTAGVIWNDNGVLSVS